MVLSRDFQCPLAAVTKALLVHNALPRDEVHRLVADNDPYHVRKESRDATHAE
jgi:hypothetical protein